VEVYLNKTHGLRNDLLIILSRSEIEDALFHIANREKFMKLPGLLRHIGKQDPEERKKVGDCKIPVEKHLKCLTQRGHELLDADGKPKRRVVVIGSRNVGNNHGFIAWQKDENPKLFHVQGDPLNHRSYSCLVRHQDGQLAIRALCFKNDRVFEDDTDITESVTWCVYGNQVLRDGKVLRIEGIIEQFYDIRHVLAFDRAQESGKKIEAEIYEGYPDHFRENALKALEKGVPRNRYMHNCLGLSEDSLFILQREGTIEEIAYWLWEAGARDGVILDNGGSVFCWTWWLNPEGPYPKTGYPKGGFLFTAPDFRLPSSAVIAFVLKGPAATDLPSGSVSFSVV